MKKKIKMTKQDSTDIIDLILRDHTPIKDLIEILKDPDSDKDQKQGAYEEFSELLIAHAKAEEQSLYVQMKEFEDLRMESFEGDAEHTIADRLVQEISNISDENQWNAKVKVLAELVEHHIREEEDEMLHDVRKQMNLSLRQSIGSRYLAFKDKDKLQLHHHHLGKDAGMGPEAKSVSARY